MTIDHHLDHAAAGRSHHRLLAQVFLNLGHLGLHLLELLEHLELLTHLAPPSRGDPHIGRVEPVHGLFHQRVIGNGARRAHR